MGIRRMNMNKKFKKYKGIPFIVKLKGKNRDGKEILKHRVNLDRTQHRIEIKRKEDGETEVYHTVWDRNLKILHHDKKYYHKNKILF